MIRFKKYLVESNIDKKIQEFFGQNQNLNGVGDEELLQKMISMGADRKKAIKVLQKRFGNRFAIKEAEDMDAQVGQPQPDSEDTKLGPAKIKEINAELFEKLKDNVSSDLKSSFDIIDGVMADYNVELPSTARAIGISGKGEKRFSLGENMELVVQWSQSKGDYVVTASIQGAK